MFATVPDVQRAKRTITTSAAGAADVDIGPFRGYLDAIIYTKVDFANGVDFTLTDKRTGEVIWSQLNVDASVIKRPSDLVQDTAGVDTTQYDKMFIDGDVNVVIANGGDAKSGTFEIVCIAE